MRKEGREETGKGIAERPEAEQKENPTPMVKGDRNKTTGAFSLGKHSSCG